MRAGRLRHEVQIEVKTVGKGTSGGMKAGAWLPFGDSVHAEIRNLSGNERRVTSAGGGEIAEARAEIEVRYLPGVLALTMRVRHGTTVYNIRHVNNVAERNERLVLTCDSGVNGG